MTDADLARWEAVSRAALRFDRSVEPGDITEALTCAIPDLIAEVRHLRVALTAIIREHTCGDECAEAMIALAEAALGDDGTIRWGAPQGAQ